MKVHLCTYHFHNGSDKATSVAITELLPLKPLFIPNYTYCHYYYRFEDEDDEEDGRPSLLFSLVVSGSHRRYCE